MLCGIADRQQLLLTNEWRSFEQKLGTPADDSDEVSQFVGNFLDAFCTQCADAVDVFGREGACFGIGGSGWGIARWRSDVRMGTISLLHLSPSFRLRILGRNLGMHVLFPKWRKVSLLRLFIASAGERPAIVRATSC